MFADLDRLLGCNRRTKNGLGLCLNSHQPRTMPLYLRDGISFLRVTPNILEQPPLSSDGNFTQTIHVAQRGGSRMTKRAIRVTLSVVEGSRANGLDVDNVGPTSYRSWINAWCRCLVLSHGRRIPQWQQHARIQGKQTSSL